MLHFSERNIDLKVSESDEDDKWDRFLEKVSCGQFEQSSLWARVKMDAGWKPIRVTLTSQEEIVAGFQILVRSKKPFGRIGYIAKGPVIDPKKSGLKLDVIQLMKDIARKRRLNALIVQAPDTSTMMPLNIEQCGFHPLYLTHLRRRFTVMIELEKSEDEILYGMKRDKRQNVRRGLSKGVIVREGTEKELILFYEMMDETCKRQGVAPNPDQSQLFKFWKIFYPKGQSRLFFATFNDAIVSGFMTILLGDTIDLWKFGWSGTCRECKPNEVLYWEIFRWAKAHGFKRANLGYVDEASAQTILNTSIQAQKVNNNWSFYKVRFGGELHPQPQPLVYFYNPIISYGYRCLGPRISNHPQLNKWMSRF